MKTPETINGNVAVDLIVEHPTGILHRHTHSFIIHPLKRPDFNTHLSKISTFNNNNSNNDSVDNNNNIENESNNNNNNNNREVVIYKNEAIIKASASYWTGVTIAESPISWTVTSQPILYLPPIVSSQYIFSIPTDYIYQSNISNVTFQKMLQSVTDEEGMHHIKIKFFGNADPPQPVNVTCIAEITDINQSTIQRQLSFVVHPCLYYVGMALPKQTPLYMNEPYDIDFVVTDHGKC